MRLRLLLLAIALLLSWLFSYLAINFYRNYSFGLFAYLPVVLGAVSTIILGYNANITKRKLRLYSFLVLLVFCLGLFVFAFDGAICIAMAAPIGLLFTFIGHLLGYILVERKMMKNIPATVIVLLASVPTVMSFEHYSGHEGTLRSVTTRIEINAPAKTVWNNVIAFPELGEPGELIFKTGIAYPTSAEIEGRGVGAVRNCIFSTGKFVEPITVWDEPSILQFDVREQPEPMKEISFHNIHPNHLHGYWVSKKGQFKLSQLANGRTLLEGTTWYENKIEPGIYWTIWSDYIVHSIHKRVLEHIKHTSEIVQ